MLLLQYGSIPISLDLSLECDIITEKNFSPNLIVVIAARGQPDVGLPKGGVENERCVGRVGESESRMGMGHAPLLLNRTREDMCIKESTVQFKKHASLVSVPSLLKPSLVNSTSQNGNWKLGFSQDQ